MIALLDKKLLILTPPKCGSTSLHTYLCQHVDSVFIIGPQLDGRIDKHTGRIPFDFRNYKRYLVVRNPYTRFISLYKHHLLFNQYKSVDEFIKTYHKNPFNQNISDVYKIQFNYWKLENLSQCLKDAGISYKVPLLNESEERSEGLTLEQKIKISQWAKPDCESFNYDFFEK
jgi:hypothetical protein